MPCPLLFVGDLSRITVIGVSVFSLLKREIKSKREIPQCWLKRVVFVCSLIR